MRTQRETLYDALMRLPIIAFNLVLLLREVSGIRGLVALHPYLGGDWSFVATLAARVSIVIFLVVLVSLHAARRRPIGKYSTWWPKLTALIGTVLPLVLVLTARAPADALWNGLSTVLILAGSTLSVLVVLDLGRSLSVMPEARKLVTTGLYQRVRHPLYLAEEIATIGLAVQFRTWEALLIVAIHFYFQIRRMDWEEGILGKSFPEYVDYARRSCRLVPGLY
jgi:protein-S-isoprenylcysteine O-methyltransferase Ste14